VIVPCYISNMSTARNTRKSDMRISCALGVACINAKAIYNAKLEEWQRQGGTGDEPARINRGHQFKLSSAVEYYAGGWLPCGHFCCDVLLEKARAYCDANPAASRQTCAEIHLASECKRRGDKDLEATRAELDAERARTHKRPNASNKSKAALAQVMLLWWCAHGCTP
jgi:hypothetical protein